MKKVIFVGSTPYSGSTFFHMILANDPKGFAAGEVRSLFNPYRAHHVSRACGCGDEDCTVWQHVLENGVDHAYETLFELFPEVEFVVDSSKSPFWIRSQSEILRRRGAQVENILVWKTPLEFAHSCERRGRFEGWNERWVNYHRLYASLMEDWVAVEYRALTRNGPVLEGACQRLGISYFPGKERYWEKTQHVLGGNYSAKFHSYSSDEAEAYLAGSFDQERIQFYRTIYYREIEDQALGDAVEETVHDSKEFKAIERLLKARDVANGSMAERNTGAVRLSAPELAFRKVLYLARTQMGRLRYGRSGPNSRRSPSWDPSKQVTPNAD